MAVSMLKSLHQAISRCVPRVLLTEAVKREPGRQMHLLCKKQPEATLCPIVNRIELLKPIIPLYNLVSGLKTKVILKRRCKFCVLRWRGGRLYVICSKKRRHNQTQVMRQPYRTWILTHAFQCPKRPW